MRVLSFIVLSLTVALGFAIPTANPEIEKRDTATVQNVVNTLQTTTNSIVPEINTLVANGQANDANVEPLLVNLILAFTTASSALSSVESRGIESRQLDGIASLVAGIISDVSGALSALSALGAALPIVGPLLINIDTALNEVLIGLSLIVDGIITLLDGLLGTVLGILKDLGLNLVLGTLGL